MNKTNHRLIKPIIALEDEDLNKWWEQYPQVPSVLFTYENSGRAQRLAPPYRENRSDNGLSIEQAAPGWSILGYSLNPPFMPSDYDAVAIMLESPSGEQVWWHFCQH